MATYNIGPHTFYSQRAVTEYMRALIARHPPDTWITDPDDYWFVHTILHCHPRADTKLGAGIYAIKRGGPHTFDPDLFIQRVDGSMTDISWTHCINTPSHRTRVLKALRFAVASQVIAYMQEWLPKTPVCPLLGIALNPGNYAVDHIPPETFESLVDRFLAFKSLSVSQIELTTGDNQIGRELADQQLAQDFAQFHREHARLRIISEQANLTVVKTMAKKPLDNRAY
jgi:hypothetical protein